MKAEQAAPVIGLYQRVDQVELEKLHMGHKSELSSD